MKYFDSHAHYYDERFESEINESVDVLIDALLKDSVSYILNVGTSPATSRLAIEQAKKFNGMYVAAGIHPSDTRFLSDIDSELAEIEAILTDKENKCVCLGEIGLDYHYDGTDKEKQMAYFERQMLLAEKLGLPVCIHDREAHADVMEVIRRHPNVKGILHSFSGSVEMATELIKLGYYISFSGTLTFTNAKKPREVAAALPKDKVLIETDCPYLTPHPHRVKINHSGYLTYTNATLASIFGVSEEECALITEQNARRILGI
jgi:TatD DNase family protein